jgi:hypothetical protein
MPDSAESVVGNSVEIDSSVSPQLVFVMYWGLGLICLIYFLELAALLCLRQLQPLKSRSPMLISVSLLSAFLVGVVAILMLIFPSDQHVLLCQLASWGLPIVYPAIPVTYILRSYRLHYVLNVVPSLCPRNSISAGSQQPMIVAKAALKVREHRLMNWLLASLVCILLVRLAIFASTFTVRNSSDFASECVFLSANQVATAGLGVMIIESFLLLMLIVFTSSIRPDYAMNNELTAACITTFGCAIPLSLYPINVIHFSSPSASLMLVSIVFLLRCFLHILCAFLPIYNTFKDNQISSWDDLVPPSAMEPLESQPLKSSVDSLRSLNTLLDDFTCMQYFRKFLTQHFVVEYLLCL